MGPNIYSQGIWKTRVWLHSDAPRSTSGKKKLRGIPEPQNGMILVVTGILGGGASLYIPCKSKTVELVLP